MTPDVSTKQSKLGRYLFDDVLDTGASREFQLGALANHGDCCAHGIVKRIQ